MSAASLACIVTQFDIVTSSTDKLTLKATEWMADQFDGQRVREEIEARGVCKTVLDIGRYAPTAIANMLAQPYKRRARKLITINISMFPVLTATISQLGPASADRSEFDRELRKQYNAYNCSKKLPVLTQNFNPAIDKGSQFALVPLQTK